MWQSIQNKYNSHFLLKFLYKLFGFYQHCVENSADGLQQAKHVSFKLAALVLRPHFEPLELVHNPASVYKRRKALFRHQQFDLACEVV